MSVKSVWTVNNLQHTCYIYRYLTFICIYINRLCACSPYKCCLYTKLHALNCTHVQVHFIYRRNPHWTTRVELRRQHSDSHTLTRTHTQHAANAEILPATHIPLKEQSDSCLSGTSEGNTVCVVITVTSWHHEHKSVSAGV